MTSTTAISTPAGRAAQRHLPTALAVVFWLALWQVAAWVVGRDFLLASPVQVVARLGELSLTASFWGTVGASLSRIAVGFLAATIVGAVGAILAARFRLYDALSAPLISTIRTVPVVSFIILLLLWTDPGWLAAMTSFLMVLPVMHTSVLAGIRNRDGQLLEVSRVFAVPTLRRIRAIDTPAVLPFFVAACHTGIGLAWKSGVAAEVIGVTNGSIGERLYEAKLYLESADLFAWTLVVVLVSVACEATVMWSLRRAQARVPGGLA